MILPVDEGSSRLYFPLATNEEQRQIIHKLNASSSVVVKGPPGTGKSHTIANLMCHLLASGERVLITAHAPKALTVLREMLPEEMRDLEFKPAIPAFAEMLGTKYGYYAAAGLKPFGTDAVPALIGAIQNTNPVVRVNAASLFDWNYGVIRDSRLTEAVSGWLNDTEPRVRSAAIQVLSDYSNWNPKYAGPLVSMLRDENARVRRDAETGLIRHSADAEKFTPVFNKC